MAEIKTRKGETILVDDEDFEWLNQWAWWVRDGYALGKCGGMAENVRMHRLIMGVTDPNVMVDHDNCDGLDNRRHNLRVATRPQNCQNRRINANKVYRFKGVKPQTRGSGFVARISFQGKRRYLGTFPTEDLAYEFYCLAADMLHGEFARYR